jgi:hypothetical protein
LILQSRMQVLYDRQCISIEPPMHNADVTGSPPRMLIELKRVGAISVA